MIVWCIYYFLVISFCYVFFFKQKTAYEMRISDWSSDVCSSELAGCAWPRLRRQAPDTHPQLPGNRRGGPDQPVEQRRADHHLARHLGARLRYRPIDYCIICQCVPRKVRDIRRAGGVGPWKDSPATAHEIGKDTCGHRLSQNM